MPAPAFDYDPKFHDDIQTIVRKFNRLGMPGSKRVARRAVIKAARFLVKQAKTIAPVKTGKLKSKGFQIMDRRGRIGDVIRVASTARRERLGIAADSKWYYPAIVEFGPKKGPRRWPGKRFMERTFRAHGEAAKRLAVDAMLIGVETELAKK